MEAFVTPGLTILTAIWYTETEVPFRVLMWCSFNGWAGIFGGFVAYGVGHISHPAVDLWKYIFLILGAVTIACENVSLCACEALTMFPVAFVLWFWFSDSPVEARFLTAEEKILAIKRVAEAKIGVKNRQFKLYQVH